MDFSFCQEESQKVEFIQCAENLTRDETASCTADEAIFDTSQFTSTVPTEFHLACGSQVFLLRGNTRLSVSRSSMDSPLLYHSSVFLLALAPVDICLISTDGKQRSWSEFFSTESGFYVRRLCRAMRRLLFSEFLSKEQIKLLIWRLLSTVSFVYEIIHWTFLRLWNRWPRRSSLHGNDPKFYIRDRLHDHVLVFDDFPGLAATHLIHCSSDISVSAHLVVLARESEIFVSIWQVRRGGKSDETLLQKMRDKLGLGRSSALGQYGRGCSRYKFYIARACSYFYFRKIKGEMQISGQRRNWRFWTKFYENVFCDWSLQIRRSTCQNVADCLLPIHRDYMRLLWTLFRRWVTSWKRLSWEFLKTDVITKLMSTVNNVINGAVEVIAYVVAFFLLNIIGTALKD